MAVSLKRKSKTHSRKRNINYQKLSKLTLQTFEDRFELLASVSDAMVKDIDLTSGSVWFSESRCRYFNENFSSFDSFLRAWRSRIYPDDEPRVMDGFYAALDSDLLEWQEEYRLVGPSGRTAIVTDRVNFIRDRRGVPIRITGILLDITSVREYANHEGQLQKLKSFCELAGGVAHDINNLLTVILGSCEFLERSCESEFQFRFTSAIIKASESAAALTARMLLFSRRNSAISTPAPVNKLVGSMEDVLRASLGGRVRLYFRLSPDAGQVEVDQSKFEMSLLNLAINARDAMPSGGDLIFETSNVEIFPSTSMESLVCSPGNYVLIRVVDTGCGMPPDVVSRAFEPFFTTKAVGAGSGLGLSAVFDFMKQSGGCVYVESEVSVGSTFSLFLPRTSLQNSSTEFLATQKEFLF